MQTGSNEKLFLEPDELLKRASGRLINDAGRIIAVITLIVAALVSFTEVGWGGVMTEEFSSTLVLMLIAAYVMFFSLMESGERLGESSPEYKAAKEEYDKTREKIHPEDVVALELFLENQAERSLEGRRRELLMNNGVSPLLLSREVEPKTKRERRAVRRAMRIKKRQIDCSMLLDSERESEGGELYLSGTRKLLRIVLKLLPTTVCMIFTASIMLGARGDLTASVVIESILRLSTLPIVGFRGYSFGYCYVKRTLTAQFKAKARLLSTFLSSSEAREIRRQTS